MALVHRGEALAQRWLLALANRANLEALSIGRDLERRLGRDVEDLQDGLVDNDAVAVADLLERLDSAEKAGQFAKLRYELRR